MQDIWYGHIAIMMIQTSSVCTIYTIYFLKLASYSEIISAIGTEDAQDLNRGIYLSSWKFPGNFFRYDATNALPWPIPCQPPEQPERKKGVGTRR